MSLDQIAREVGRTRWQTFKLLNKLGWIGIKTKRGSAGRTLVYDAHSVEVIKGLLKQSHRPVGLSDNWLTNYLNTQGAPDGRRIRPDQRDPGTSRKA